MGVMLSKNQISQTKLKTILFVSVILLFICSSQVKSDMTIPEIGFVVSHINCDVSGKVQFDFNYDGGVCNTLSGSCYVVMPIENLNISIRKASSSTSLKLINNVVMDPTLNQPEKIVTKTQNSHTYHLISQEKQLMNNGVYYLKISSDFNPSKSSSDKTNSYGEYSFSCPGYKYSCGQSNINIDSCYSDDFYFYAKIKGLSPSTTNLNINNINFLLNPLFRDLSPYYVDKFPSNYNIFSDTIGDKYILKIPKKSLLNPVEKMGAEINDCGCTLYGYDNCLPYKTCTSVPKCSSNNDCYSMEYCDNNTNQCKLLECDASKCETPKNHQCTSTCVSEGCSVGYCAQGTCQQKPKENCCKMDSDCNDNLGCTIDTCTNGQCSHNEKVCSVKSADPCIIAYCVEPDGCAFGINNSCQSNIKTDAKKVNDQVKESISQLTSNDIKNLNFQEILSTNSPYLLSLNEGELVNFTIFGEDHSVYVSEIQNDRIKITFKSDPMTYIINLLQSVYIDLNQDGTVDFAVKLDKIGNKTAQIGIIPPTIGMGSTVPLEKKSSLFTSFSVITFLIAILVIGVVLGGFYKYKSSMKTKKQAQTKNIDVNEIKKEKLFSNATEAITVDNFTVKHGKNIILNDVSFTIKSNTLTAILGPSGAGKSTIIESLVERKKPESGKIKIFGEKYNDVKNYIGFVPQHNELYLNQSVKQNLVTSVVKWGLKVSDEKIDSLLKTLLLFDRKEVMAKSLSGGQLKLLSLGMELIRDAELLILDEPTTGLDPNSRNEIMTILSRLVTNHHKTVVMTTHFMDDAEEADDIIIVAKRKIVAHGSPQKLEKMIPGQGKVLSITLDTINNELIQKIEKIDGVVKLISEGRAIKILSENVNLPKFTEQISSFGGVIMEAKVIKATMMEVFVYFTGEKVEE